MSRMTNDTQSILRLRAIAMAIEPEQIREASAMLEIIEFIIGGEKYGIESSFVREVYPLKDFTSLPGTPAFILGIVNVRGNIISIVDLKKFFNLPEKGLGELNKLIIIQNEIMQFAILADLVNETKQIYKEDILPVPITISGIGEKYLQGITAEQLIILSAENLLNDKNIVVNEEIV